MHGTIGKRRRKIYGQERPSADSSVPITFRDLARFAWPAKAEANLSFLTGYDARTCRRWLAGHTEPPAEALSVILGEIMRRFSQR